MPSHLHEALLLLFRNRPELAPELLRDALHVELPPYSEARIESAELVDINPAEYRAWRAALAVVSFQFSVLSLEPHPQLKPHNWRLTTAP